MNSKITKLAAAAVVIIVISLFVWEGVFETKAVFAFGDVSRRR